jgi:hypothetical protein
VWLFPSTVFWIARTDVPLPLCIFVIGSMDHSLVMCYGFVLLVQAGLSFHISIKKDCGLYFV